MDISNETRLVEINAKISAIHQRMSLTVGQKSQQIRALLEETQDLELSPEVFQEFLPDAEEALNETLYTIRSALDHAILHEAEQARIQTEQAAEAARLKAEREAMERQQAEWAARQREQLLMDDPLADLKRVVNADIQIADALDEAYQRVYEAGHKAGQHP